jgi:primosomal protein N' (replication factor Y)
MQGGLGVETESGAKYCCAAGETQLIAVAVPRPLLGLFTYKISKELADQVQVGGWVKVPLGRSVTHAFVVEPPQSSSISNIPAGLSMESLKSVLSVGEQGQILTPDVLALCKWAHEYYFIPLGEILNCAVPAALLQPKSKRTRRTQMMGLPETSEALTDPSSPNITHCGKILTENQLRVVSELEANRKGLQKNLEKNLGLSGGKPVALLHGVTGSGKTEVYIELAKKVLNEGKSVIILVPEIALTPQLHHRFESGLGTSVGLWHSAVSAGRRRNLVADLKSKEIRVVVGARSAVFAPVQDLGLVVVDEEHDSTFKQEDRAKYHARDLAVVRGKLTGAMVVLGSATPSLETRERVREGRYALSRLDQRIASGGMPQIEIVDLRKEEKVQRIQAPLALRSLEMIQETLKAGEQVMVYLNRRGFAAFLLCQECGEVRNCPNCSISLTVHRQGLKLKCHVCGFQEAIPNMCSKCHGTLLKPIGAGTESLELDLPQWVPDAKILRLDRDQITSVGRLSEILERFRNGEANLLLGTQMLVKGHDFPSVTLVVVILADALFRWPDFRAPERAFQILKQVAGRAGRGTKPGKILIQTFDPEHSVLQSLQEIQKEEVFFETERDLRQALGYPPFGRLARLRLESSNRTVASQRAQTVVEFLQKSLSQKNAEGKSSEMGLEILGPSEAFLEKMKGVYRWDILLKAKNIQPLQKAILLARAICASRKWRMVADIDPHGV